MRLAVAGVVGVLAGVIPGTGVGQQDVRRNVLLVTVDALRADRVHERLMPALAALAAQGARFERAYAHTPQTLPAVTSLLTGLRPPSHGIRNNGFRLDDTVVTLAEVLRGAGYRTGAFPGAAVLDARFGLNQGFQVYDDAAALVEGPAAAAAFRYGARRAPEVLAAAAQWLAAQPSPWFAWAHLRDPHAPYDAPGRRAAHPYDNEVAFVDAAIDDFLGPLREKGLLADTVIAVAGDHGESLGEHGEQTHALFGYDPSLRVPLIVAGPGVPAVAIGQAVSHSDVMPTILDLIGVTGPAADGRSLVPLLQGKPLPDAPIYIEALDASLMRGWAPLTGVIAGGWKYIDLPIPELYDLERDPGEGTNVAASEPERAQRLRDETGRLRTASFRADGAGAVAEPEARARLRSLGYVGSASWRLGAWRVEDDPKRLLYMHRAYERALELAAGDPEAAIRQLRLLIEQRPDFAAAYDAAGALLVGQGRFTEAVTLLSEALAGGLRHRIIGERLGAALLAAGDAKTAIAVLEPLVDSDGAAADARFLLARAYAAAGQRGEAMLQLRAALRVDPTFPEAEKLLEKLGR